MKRRRGVTIFESVVACLVMGVAVTTAAQLTVAVAHHQRACRQHAVALQEASNALEIALASDAPEQAGPEQPRPKQFGLSPPAKALLAGGRLDVSRSAADVSGRAADESPDGERVVITVVWNARNSGARHEVRLVGWRFSARESGE